MADTRKIARQWLETDAALGASEVPFPRVRTGAKAAPIAPVAPVAPRAPAVPARPVPMAAREVVRPAPAPRPTHESPAPVFAVRDEMAFARKKPSESFAIAAGPTTPIASLPQISREQKIQQLETLLAKTQVDCAAYIDDIATKVVFGEGNPDALILFIGEGPGAEEDKTGRPFVGKSGQLLDKMIVAMGFQREQVYIANVVKLRCASPDDLAGGRLKDRPPTPEEAGRGLPILQKQIEIIRPKVIVTLGAPAIKHLTGTTEGVTKIRGTWLQYRGIPVMPTYHPAFVLRAYTPENRRKVWSDLQMAMAKIKE